MQNLPATCTALEEPPFRNGPSRDGAVRPAPSSLAWALYTDLTLTLDHDGHHLRPAPAAPHTPPRSNPPQLFIPPIRQDAQSSMSSLLAIPNMDLGNDLLTDDLFKPGATPMRERATHVIQLAEENKKLADELRAMDERLKAAERRAEELKRKLVKDGGQV